MRIQTFYEVLAAAHLAHHVEHPNVERGGIMLVANPGSLKTTLIRSIREYPDAQVFSDINVQTLIGLKPAISSGRLNTLGFSELEKLYQRRDATAMNLEGHIKAMVEEGFSHAAFQNQMMRVPVARCLVIGGITYGLLCRKYDEWLESGFLRRFLWCFFDMAVSDCLMNAAERLVRIDLEEGLARRAWGKVQGKIPLSVTPEQSAALRSMLDGQQAPIDTLMTPFSLLQKILSVLVWRHGDADKAWKIMLDFSECLDGKKWARVMVPDSILISGSEHIVNNEDVEIPFVNVSKVGRPKGSRSKTHQLNGDAGTIRVEASVKTKTLKPETIAQRARKAFLDEGYSPEMLAARGVTQDHEYRRKLREKSLKRDGITDKDNADMAKWRILREDYRKKINKADSQSTFSKGVL